MQKTLLADGLCLPTVQIPTFLHCNRVRFRLTHRHEAPTLPFSQSNKYKFGFFTDICRMASNLLTKGTIYYTTMLPLYKSLYLHFEILAILQL